MLGKTQLKINFILSLISELLFVLLYACLSMFSFCIHTYGLIVKKLINMWNTMQRNYTVYMKTTEKD